jgi:hypothetical protein
LKVPINRLKIVCGLKIVSELKPIKLVTVPIKPESQIIVRQQFCGANSKTLLAAMAVPRESDGVGAP